MRYVIETDRLRHNVSVLRRELGNIPLIAVLKCNGYGMGLTGTALRLADEGITDFAVLRFDEAAALRALLPDAFIMLLTPAINDAQAQEAVQERYTACVDCVESAQRLERAAAEADVIAPVQLVLDTGFGRYGFAPGQEALIVDTMNACPHLAVVGTYAHFHSAFGNGGSVKHQTSLFLKMTGKLQALGLETGRRHIANSAAALRFPDTRLDAVRVGSALCGRLSVADRWGFQPVGHMEAPITALRQLKAGANLGYGDMYHLKKDATIAIVPVGHSNGYGMSSTRDSYRLRDIARYLWNDVKDLRRDHTVWVTVNGQKAPLAAGRGLTNCFVDVTGIDCRVGDTVVLPLGPVGIPEDVPREYR
ncbi:MAG: alanine racemase [Clostridia bacterium]|nr:alanine racemase [Clostridia bacterium]